MGTLVKMPGKGVARPSSSKGGGLDLMNQAIKHFAPALAISNRYSVRWQASICTIGIVGEPRSVETARKIHDGFLAAMAEMDRAYKTVHGIMSGHPEVDRASALSMLNVLFAAIGKRKSDDESIILLNAAADMFNPVNDVLGCITGVERINRHPLVLASAIKKLIATAKFTSCAELYKAMQSVEHFIGIQAWHLDFMIERIHTADAMLFEEDRAAWNEAYTNVDSKVVLLMREWSELMGEGPCEELDENGNPEYPPSPRWQALDDLVKAKAAIPKSEPREAACEAKAAKRRRKPKLVEV
jgi:hypothetical protein